MGSSITKIVAENKSLKEKSHQLLQSYEELTLKEKTLLEENNQQKEQINQLNIDLNVLKALMKEMIMQDNLSSNSQKYSGNTDNDVSINYSADNSRSFDGNTGGYA